MHPEFENRERWVKAMKEAAVQAVGPGENDDMPPVVDVLRNGKPAVTVLCKDVNRDQGLHAAYVGITGFAGDEVWLVLDSHMSNTPINPVTGETWGPGEMQAGCEGAEMCSLGIITDCMMVLYGTREGTYQMRALPYHVHKTERTIRWVDEGIVDMDPEDPDAHQFDGLVLDAIKDAFAAPLGKDVIANMPEADISLRLQSSRLAKQGATAVLRELGHEVSPA